MTVKKSSDTVDVAITEDIDNQNSNASKNTVNPKVDENDQDIDESDELQDDDGEKENVTGTDADTRMVLRQASGGEGILFHSSAGGPQAWMTPSSLYPSNSSQRSIKPREPDHSYQRF
jgi:hypothetical protein